MIDRYLDKFSFVIFLFFNECGIKKIVSLFRNLFLDFWFLVFFCGKGLECECGGLRINFLWNLEFFFFVLFL